MPSRPSCRTAPIVLAKDDLQLMNIDGNITDSRGLRPPANASDRESLLEPDTHQEEQTVLHSGQESQRQHLRDLRDQGTKSVAFLILLTLSLGG